MREMKKTARSGNLERAGVTTSGRMRGESGADRDQEIPKEPVGKTKMGLRENNDSSQNNLQTLGKGGWVA